MKNKKFSILMVIVFLLSISLFIFALLNEKSGLTTDGTCYVRLAQNLFDGKGYTLSGMLHTVFPPGYPILIGLFALVLKDYLLAAQLISFLSTLGAAFVIFVILSKVIEDKTMILLFEVVFLFNTTIVRLFYTTSSDSLYIFFMILNLLVVYNITTDNQKLVARVVFIGIICGIMYLIRPDGLIFFAVNIIFLFILFLKRKCKLRHLALTMLPFIFIAFPYVQFLHNATGKWILSGKSMNFVQLEVIENKDDPYLLEKNAYKLINNGRDVMVTAAAFSDFNPHDYILQNMNKILKRCWINIFSYIKVILSTFGLLSFSLIYIVKTKKNLYLLYLGMIIISSAYLLLFSINRYWISFMPVFIFIFAIICSTFFSKNQIHRKISIVLVLTGIISNFYFGREAFNTIFASEKDSIAERKAAVWVERNIAADEYIIVRKPFIPFYSGHEWIRIPWFESSIDFVNYMSLNNFKYFTLSNHERLARPFLNQDEKSGKINGYCELLYQCNSNGNIIKIFRIL